MISRPAAEEYDPAFARYINRVPEGDLIQILQSQAKKTIEVFEQFSEEKGNYSYAPGKWTLKEVLGHVIDFERIFSYRALCIARGDQQSLPGYDENEYARVAGYSRLSLIQVVKHFANVRTSTISLLEQIPEEAFLTVGKANQKAISVRALAFSMAGHELHHLSVVAERYH